MRLNPEDIDQIIGLIEQITTALSKTDFLSPKEQEELEQYREYEHLQRQVQQYRSLQVNPRDVQYRHLQYCQKKLTEMTYDSKRAALLHHMLLELKKKNIESKVPPLQKELDLFLSPRWKEVLALSDYGYQFRKEIEGYFVKRSSVLATDEILASQANKVVRELERIKAKIEYDNKKPAEIGQDNTTAKCRRISIRIKKIIEKTWQIFNKSFCEAVLDRMWPK